MTLEHSAFVLAAALGIRIADARRYLETGLSADDVEACAKVAAKGAAALDDIVDILVRARRSDNSRPVFSFSDPGRRIDPVDVSTPSCTGTLRRSFRSTCNIALRLAS